MLEKNNVYVWKDSSGSKRHARSESFVTAPRLINDPQTGINMVDFDFGDRLNIDSPVSMPMTIFMVGRESGMSLPNREFFSSQGWRLANSGNWSLLPWDTNNPIFILQVHQVFFR